MNTALVAGATGLIGEYIVQHLLAHPSVPRVFALSRKPWPTQHDRLEVLQFPLHDLQTRPAPGEIENVFIALGTTMAKAGSKQAFEEVDFKYVLNVAEWGRKAGATRLLVVSAMGADSSSLIYYNRVKGKMEEAVSNLGYEQVHIFRPSLLDGPRQEKRLAEQWSLRLFRWIKPLMIGPLAPYRVIHAETVAKAMLVASSSEQPGVHIYPSHQIASMVKAS